MSEGQRSLSATGRYLVLVTAFLGWFFGGVVMSTSALSMRSAAIDLLSRTGSIDLPRFQKLNEQIRQGNAANRPESVLSSEDQQLLKEWRLAAQTWYAYFQCAMLFGAALGGLVFGRIGDRFGRSRGMAGSILCFSVFSGLAYFSQTPIQLLIVWFIGCLGIGGMWPNGVSLVSETWSNMSRPMIAGVMGASANIGLFAMATLATYINVTTDHWRWMLLICAAPTVLGLFVIAAVPESPRWMASRKREVEIGTQTDSIQVFRRPLLATTVLGIVLASIPLVGGWGSANWMVPWAGEAGETANQPNYRLKAQVHQARALPGMLGTFLGGWIAHLFGRRRSFFFCSIAALICAQWIFWTLQPTDPTFLVWVGALGFFSGVYFGWLPLFLPELFPTQVRSTGTGVSFNFGRFVTAFTVLATGAITAQFGGSYPRIGRVTSFVFLIGAIAIWWAPDTTKRQLQD